MTPQHTESHLDRGSSKETKRLKGSVYSVQSGSLHVGGGSSFCVWLTGERSLWPPSEAALGLVEEASISLLANLPSAWRTATFCQPTPAFWSRLGLGGEQRREVPSCASLHQAHSQLQAVAPPSCLHTAEEPPALSSGHQPVGPAERLPGGSLAEKKCRARELIFFFQLQSC